MPDYQIEIKFTGTYQVDENTRITDPTVIAVSGDDDFISTVGIGCIFQAPTYSYNRFIGTMNYVSSWTNQDVISYITTFMQSCEV